MREKDIEKILVAEVRKLGGRAYKWVSPGNDGVPDPHRDLSGKGPGVCGAENRYRETERPPGGPRSDGWGSWGRRYM